MTLRSHNAIMSEDTRRTTIYFDGSIHRALRLKAAETDQSLSEVVNSAVRESLSEDATDLEAFESRTSEPSVSFESVVKDLRRIGKL